ncbi:hypothetical protein FGO68_gene16519 [Halteria grandinella]|uniref:Uncharacterized protein n=1 Tax=Halteria grandinella TaxID=5974 RepID=A0A8J8N8T0_HALGN|nr:hypothetical protein FGO68_gene16519 [Halteria grandinella]
MIPSRLQVCVITAGSRLFKYRCEILIILMVSEFKRKFYDLWARLDCVNSIQMYYRTYMRQGNVESPLYLYLVRLFSNCWAFGRTLCTFEDERLFKLGRMQRPEPSFPVFMPRNPRQMLVHVSICVFGEFESIRIEVGRKWDNQSIQRRISLEKSTQY